LERLASMPEGSLEAALARARIRLNHHDYAGAEAALKALKPGQRNHVSAWALLARVDLMQCRPDSALADSEAALKLEPNRASPHSLRADTGPTRAARRSAHRMQARAGAVSGQHEDAGVERATPQCADGAVTSRADNSFDARNAASLMRCTFAAAIKQ
jgi:hypothetical protein